MIRASSKSATWARSAKNSTKPRSEEKWQSVKLFVETVMRHELGIACVDLDSVLLHHNRSDGISHLGQALPLGRKLCELLDQRDYRVIVLTSRPRGHAKIFSYLMDHGFTLNDVTNIKPPADAYFDDKAYRIPKNWK